jgi:hypothetical protein
MLPLGSSLLKKIVLHAQTFFCFPFVLLQLIPCCLPRCVGIQFALVALAFQGLGLYCALVWATSNNE